MMKIWITYCVLALGLLSMALPGQAQLVQPARLELEVKDSEEFYSVISAEEEGLVVYRRDTKESSGSTDVYELRAYDQDLKERWATQLEVKDAQLTGYEYNGGKVFFLFRESEGKADNFQIYTVEIAGGKVNGYKIENAIPVELTEFTTVDNVVLMGGYANYRPTVLYFDLNEEKFRVIPGLYLNKSDLLELKTNEENNTFTVLHTERLRNRQQTISSKTYDRNANLLFEYSLQPEEGKSLIYGRTTSFGDGGLHIAGTYSHGNKKYSRGVFIASIYANGEQDVNYYNYGDLDNFFSYMKAGREKRVKKRIERRKVRGKKVKLNYKLLVHDVLERNGTNILLGEAFYPKYNNRSNYLPSSRYRFGRFNSYYDPYQTRESANLEGYRYTHAVLIAFDEEGELLWDNSFEINEVLSPTLQKYVHVLPFDSMSVLLYMYENVVHTKIIRKDEVLESKAAEELATLYETDKVRYNKYDVGGLEDWYGPYLYAYGIQRIHNEKDAGIPNNRKVFFINKLTYQPPEGEYREASRKTTD